MLCAFCGEEVAEDDRESRIACEPGFGMHRDCGLRMVVGSLGHQLGLCGCRGGPGTLDDPPGLTLREAARTAAAQWRLRNPGPNAWSLTDLVAERLESDED